MANIELPGTGPVQGFQTGALGNPSAASSPWKALGSIGNELSHLGDKGARLAVAQQEAVLERERGRFERGFRALVDGHEEEMLKTQANAENWVSGLEKKADTFKSGWKFESLPPAQREVMEARYQDMLQQARGKVGSMAAVVNLQTAKSEISADIEEDVRTGRYDDALSKVDRFGSMLTDPQKNAMRERVRRMSSLHSLDEDVTHDPREAKRLMSEEGFLDSMPGLTREDLEAAGKRADVKIRERERDALKAVSTGIETGKFATEKDLTSALESNPDIQPVWRDEILFNWQQAQPVDAETRFAIVDQLNDLHDAYADGEMNLDDYRRSHDELAQLVFSMGARDGAGGLRQRVAALDPANWNGRELKAGATEAKTRSLEKLSALYDKAGAFGSVDEAAEPAEKARQAGDAFLVRQRLEKSMAGWMKANPDATDDEIGTQYRKSYLAEISADVLAPAMKSPAARKQSLDTILGKPSGPPGARNNTPDKPVGGNLVEMVKQFEAGGEPEGFHAKAYWDNGQYSIGYGTKARAGETITKEEAARRLDVELSLHRERVIAEAGRVGLTLAQHELDALTSFDFNTGSISQLLAGGTRSKAEIASKMLLYRNSDGKRLRGLERRRIAESQLFRHGFGN